MSNVTQERLFAVDESFEESFSLMHGFVCEELADADLSAEEGVLTAIEVMAVAAETFAQTLAKIHDIDENLDVLLSETMVGRLNATDAPTAFILDVDSEWSDIRTVGQEAAGQITNRAYLMARQAIDEIVFDRSLTEVVLGAEGIQQ